MPPVLELLDAAGGSPPAGEDSGRRVAWEIEREHLLELLAHQQRVAQAGLVTAGLTHDINNHVQMISGAAFLALDGSDPNEWRDALERIQEQCRAVTDMTRAFMSFIRRQDTACAGTFAVSDVVAQTARLVRPLAKRRRVELTNLASCDAEVRGETRLAIQAVVNLATNAIEACGDADGRVAITARMAPIGYARIEVSDTGPGIPVKIRRQIFRPFATERRADRGTGLGLFIVRQIVRKLDGSIRVRTSSEGTTIQIDLPVA